jgi:hypothetical protein
MASGYTVQTGKTACTGNATKTMWLIAPGANVGFVLTEVAAAFDGAAAQQAILVELYRTTTVGSPAGTTGTAVKRSDEQADTVQSSSLVNLSAEPTAVEILRSWMIPPNGGALVEQFPLGREPRAKAGGGRIGMRYTTATGVTPNYESYGEVEE